MASDEVRAKLIQVIERPFAFVVPAEAGTHRASPQKLDSRMRGNDSAIA
jgi:hypothetical protein